MVVPDLQVGAMVARKHQLHAVTVEGDQVDRKGALTGGWTEGRQSRYEIIAGMKHWRLQQ